MKQLNAISNTIRIKFFSRIMPAIIPLVLFISIFASEDCTTPSSFFSRTLHEFISFQDAVATAAAKPKDVINLDLVVSLIWEGRDLREPNIEAVANFRKNFKGTSLIHVFDPAYFARGKAHTTKAKKALARTMLEGDKVVLHLASWQSMLSKSARNNHKVASFWRYSNKNYNCVKYDCGGDRFVWHLKEQEIVDLFEKSEKLLLNQGIPKPNAFMAAGWGSSEVLRTVAMNRGYHYDFSAVAPSVVETRLKFYPLYNEIRQSWKQITPLSKPFPTQLRTTTSTGKNPNYLIAVPFNLATTDYLTPETLDETLNRISSLAKSNQQLNFFMHLSFIQESADQHVGVMQQSLQQVFAFARKNKVSLNVNSIDLPTIGSSQSPSPATLPKTSPTDKKNQQDLLSH